MLVVAIHRPSFPREAASQRLTRNVVISDGARIQSHNTTSARPETLAPRQKRAFLRAIAAGTTGRKMVIRLSSDLQNPSQLGSGGASHTRRIVPAPLVHHTSSTGLAR
jgi:hypothetical protein